MLTDMYKRRRYKITALILSFTLFFTSIPAMAFAADSEEPDAGENDTVTEESLEDNLILEEDASTENVVMEESTEVSTVFDLGDGHKKVIYHGQQVRYEDEDGNLTDYDPSLISIEDEKSVGGKSLEDYAYENKQGDMKQYIPSELNEDTPILMEYGDYSIKMLPLDENLYDEAVSVEAEETLTPYEEVIEQETKAVYASEDGTYTYEYTSQNQGIKETIILNEKPESNVFSFELDIEGMTAELDEEQNIILLKDEKSEETVATLDAPFMNDATGEAYSTDLTYGLQEQEDGTYLVTLTVSKKYLNDSERIYPVTIDPTATWKGSSEFLDVYVISGDYADTNFYSSSVRLMVAGKGVDGTYRTYIKLPNIKSTLADKYVDSAYLTVYESGDCDADQTIKINRVTSSWTTSSITWNTKPSHASSAVNSFTTEGVQYTAHKVSIRTTIRNFLNDNDYSNYGIVLRNTTSSPEFAEFYGSRTTLTSCRPKLVVTYYDKPTVPESVSLSRKWNGVYTTSVYMKKGYNMYVTWTGIVSQNLADVEYKIIGVDGTADPTSIGSSGVDLTSYRSLDVATEDGTKVKVPYASSLPAGKYRIYIRGTDAAGMHGTAKYKTFYVDNDQPTLTNVSIDPETSSSSPTNDQTPKITWTANDTYFSKVTISVNGGTALKATTSAGTKSITLGSWRFPDDGTYSIKVTAYDKSGKSTSKTLSYYVDTTGPTISSLTTDPSTKASSPTNDQTPAVKWSINDSSLAKIQLYLDDTLIYTPSSLSTTSVNIASKRFPESGTYTFTLKATDSAGNVSSKSLKYYVDLDAPAISSIKVTPTSSALSKAHISSPTITWTSAATDVSKVAYSLDNSTFTTLTDVDGSFNIPSGAISEGTNTIYVKLYDKAGNESSVSTLTYYYESSDNYIPEIKSCTEYYGKRVITWETEAYDESLVSYELHRGTTSGFTPSDSTLVDADLDELSGLYIDKEILDEGTYYYKIKVVPLSGSITFDNPYSNAFSFANTVTEDQFTNTFGLKDYLDYLEVGMPNGTAYVEKSSGNLVYTQDDFTVSNSQLDYSMSRTYNSLSARTSMVGTGWTDSYHKEIYTCGDDLYFVDSDGSTYFFVRQSDDSLVCEETKDYALEESEDGGYILTTKDDITYTFNGYGQLTETTEPNGCTVSNVYDELGRLKTVTSSESISSDKALIFIYDEGEYQLKEVTDLGGTVYAFDYSGNLLEEVCVEDGTLLGTSSVTYIYAYGSSSGMMETIKDGEGNAYTLSYTDGRVTSLSYPDGESFSFSYSTGVTTVTKNIKIGSASHTMYTLETTFDTATGKMKTVKDADGDVTSYDYWEDGNPYLVIKETTVKGYESVSGSSITVHTENSVTETTYAYDDNENLETETSSDGTVTTYAYDDETDDLLAEITINGDTVLESVTYTYDDNGNVTSVEDGVTGSVETYVYTDIDLDDEDAVSEAEEDGVNAVSPYAGNAIEITVTESVSVEQDDTSTEEGDEDTESAATGTVSTDAEVSESSIDYSEEEACQVVESSTTTGTVSSNCTETYDAMGRVITSVENGTTTTNTYDFMGRVTETTVSQEGKGDIVTTYSYDKNGTLLSESTTGGTTKTYTYDSRNRKLSESISGDGMSTGTTYTAYGYAANVTVSDGLTTRTEAYTYTETTSNGSDTTLIKYIDVSGNTVKEVAGDTVSHYTYDKSGNRYASYLTDSTGSLSSLTLSLYDADGNNFAQVSQPETGSGSYVIGDNTIVTYSSYDAAGNLIRETSGSGIVTTYSYDDENRLTACNIDDTGDENDITVAYDSTASSSQVITVTDANGNQKVEKLNWSGLTTETEDISNSGDEDSMITSYEFDDYGRKVKETYSDDSYITYSYTGSSENISVKTTYAGAESENQEAESTTTYTYDDFDRVLTAVVQKDGSTVSSTAYTYDAEGKKISETVSYGLSTEETTTYAYDSEGRLVKTTYPDGSGLEDVTYTYDVQGNLLTVSHDGSLVCEYSYDGLGQLVSMKEYKEPGASSSGYILRTYAYDSHGRCISIKYLDNGSEESILESFAYTYDKDNQILTCTHVNNLPEDGSAINETRSYVYDNYGYLTQSTITDHNNSDAQSVTAYTYDAVGNRLSKTEDGSVTEYTYNGLNQLTEAETADAVIDYVYDARGNQISETNETESTLTVCTYAVTGEMTELVISSGETTLYTQENTYNHEGIRISKTEGSTTRRYYYDNGIVAYTKDGTSVSSSNVLSADGELLGTYRDSVYYTYTKDTQNSTESIIKEDSSLTAAYSYTDFGETTELTESSFDNEICYTGAVYDAESGLYYMNARYYDPENGRFISQDTYRGELDEVDQWHLYAYCANNPINYTDPSGHAKSNKKHRYGELRWSHYKKITAKKLYGDVCEIIDSNCLFLTVATLTVAAGISLINLLVSFMVYGYQLRETIYNYDRKAKAIELRDYLEKCKLTKSTRKISIYLQQKYIGGKKLWKYTKKCMWTINI